MQVFIIRHAHALEGRDDAVRPLSRRGREQIRAMARCLKRAGVLGTRQFWHSPLVRARDTAVALVDRLNLSARLVDVPDLEPHRDPAVIARRLRKHRESVAVVGHEPQLSALASLLVTGAAAPSAFELRKCAVLALQRERGHWVVCWQISPELLE